MSKWWVILATSTALLPVSVLAQVTPAPTASEADSSDFGQEIVVTAQKKAELLIDVPQSITAVTADDLNRLNATQLRDFTSTVPGLTVTSTGVGRSQITLRGVTSGEDIGPTTGVYVDEVPYGSSTAYANGAGLALDAGLFDLDRVEVLRGPQGTLYGASAMGGLLKYVTKQPDLQAFGGFAQGGVSSTRFGGVNYNVAAALNAPLVTDKVAVRASGYYNHDAGTVDNLTLDQSDVDRSRVYGGRVDVMLKPNEDLSIRLTGFAQNIHRGGLTSVDYTRAGDLVDGPFEQRRFVPEPYNQRYRVVSGTINYDLGFAALTSVTSYQTVRTDFVTDASALYVPLFASLGLNFGSVPIQFASTTDKFTQEVRLASSGDNFFEWAIGGFYTHEKSGNRQAFLPTTVAGTPSPIDLLHVSLPTTYDEIAGFGNVTVHLTDKFEVGGGVRVARNKQSFTQNATGILVASQPTNKSHETVATYLANVRYKFSDHASAYARFATGYRPGGPNAVIRDLATGELLAPATFKSDSLYSYEAGFKGETSDRTFGIDIAAYHIDWKNMLVPSSAQGVGVIINADRAKIDGAELTLTARPSRELTFSGAFAYQDARLAKASAALGGRAGERLPNVPKWMAAINADYADRGEGLRPSLGATLRFISDRRSSFDASIGYPQFDLGDYVTLDLRAGATLATIDFQVYLRNAFDSRGKVSATTLFSALGGPANVAIVQPRTIGISATKRF